MPSHPHLSPRRIFLRQREFLVIGGLLAITLTMGINGSAHAPDRFSEVPQPDTTEVFRLPPASPLATALDRILENPAALSVMWGVHVENILTGEILYHRNARVNVLPASNMKLFTTAAALDALGSEYRYETHLRFVGQIVEDTMVGDLIIEGSGDPTFGSRRFDGDPLRDWARGLLGMGIKRIQGRIIGDAQIFKSGPYAEGWDIAHISTQSYAPSAGGLSYRDNLVDVSVEAARRVGAAPVVRTDPEGYISVRNDAATSARARRSSLEVDRTLGTNNFSFSGSLRSNYSGSLRLPVHDPTAFTLHAFRTHLIRAGIQAEVELVDARNLSRPVNYPSTRTLFVHSSPPLAEIVSIINKRSDNFYAEQLFRTIAWGGTMDGGERRIKNFLSRAGIDASSMALRDGSGLSRKNMVSAEAMTRLVAYMYRDHPEREAFIASLPGGGEEETTMRNRLHANNVKAKTGSIEFVRALSGFTFAPSGEPVAFSVIANNYASHAFEVSRIQDEIVLAINTHNLR